MTGDLPNSGGRISEHSRFRAGEFPIAVVAVTCDITLLHIITHY